MSREKQIEEMARELCDATQKTNQGCNSICYPRGMCAHCKVMAEHLYNAGYRKASEVAEEIFGEIDKILSHKRDFNCSEIAFGYEWALAEVRRQYAELKKKYTEGGE